MLSKLLLALPCLFLISCVTSTRKVNVKVPEGSRPGSKGRMDLVQIVDKRVFEKAPGDPGSPSLAMQTKKGTSTETVVGRQRSGFGKAHANIVLVSGQTVPERMRAILTEGLARRGYTVGAGGMQAQVEVTQFWAWMNPGMWTLVLEGKIECIVRLGGGRQIVVKGHGENYCQAATDINWRQAYEFTIEDFLKNLEMQLAAGGF